MDEMVETTRVGMTQTSHGVIPHLRHPEYGYEMPVKIRTNSEGVVSPVYYKGALVYAMPGGGEYIGPVVEALQ